METSLLEYFVLNDQLKNTCDFNPVILDSGPGIYEVFKVVNGIPLFLEEHIDRFYNSVQIDHFELTFSRKELLFRLKSLIESNKLKSGNVRFQYIRLPEKGYVFVAWVLFRPAPTKEAIRNGVQIQSFRATRNTPHSKRTNPNLWKETEKIISPDHVVEVLLVNEKGLVTEGSRSNIFFVKGNKLFAPDRSLVLPGITMLRILEIAGRNNIPFAEKDILLQEISNYDACFLSSTSKGVLHIKRIDEVEFKVPHPVISLLEKQYNREAELYLSHFRWE